MMRSFRVDFAALSLSLLAIVGLLTIISIPAASAQGIITGGIAGTVTDQGGAVIPNASIKVTNEATGAELQGKTNGEGDFRIVDVPIGTYTVKITASGFGTTSLGHVQVVAGNNTPLGKVTLTLGKAAETVEVEGAASELINTESAQVEDAISTEQISSAPVTGAIDNLTLMVPGVVQVHAYANSNTNGLNYSVNGQRGRSNNSEIDGQTNNDTSIGGPSFFFSNQDAIQELQVVTTDMGAQYGRNMGAITNYITKSGTNQFHGTVFEMYTGSWLSSLMQYQEPWYLGVPSVTVPRFVQNNWGASGGGPILRNKLWFFGSGFWSHNYESGVPVTSQGGFFPDTTGLATLKSTFASNPAVAAMVANGPFGSTITKPTTIPVSSSTCTTAGLTASTNGNCLAEVTDGTSSASVEVAQYGTTVPNFIFDKEYLGRIDYQMSDKDKFYLRYNYQLNPYSAALYLVTSAVAAGGGYPAVSAYSHEAGGDWTHTFTTSLSNQLRYAFQESNIGFYGGAIPSCTINNQLTCTSTVEMGTPFAQYGYGDNVPQGRFVKVNQVQDNASWTKGKHTILFGMEFDYQDSPWGWLPQDEGTFNFAAGATETAANPSGVSFNYPGGGSTGPCAGGAGGPCNNGLTGFLEGIGALSLSTGSPTIPFKENDIDFYVQDNFKVTNSLTLNLGVRYEFWGQAINFLHNETVARQNGSSAFWSKSLPLSATTIQSVPNFYRNIEPRIGFAYTPPFAPKMVVHGGYSINADPEFYAIFVDLATSTPAVNSSTIICNPGATTNPTNCVASGGLTFATVQAADVKYLPTGGDPRINPVDMVTPNFHNPQSETYTFGFQYQVLPTAVLSVGYVGNHTYGQFQAFNSNPDIAAVQASFSSYGAGTSVCTTAGATGVGRENCNYSTVETFGNTAFSLYNALQTSLTTRNLHGFTGTASYTWSKIISNTSDFGVGGAAGQASDFAQDPLNIDVGERGVDGNSYPSLWGIQLTYTEPWFASQHGIIGRLLGGYSLNSFYQYNSGQAWNPIQGYYEGGGGTVTSLPVQSDICTANPDTFACGYTGTTQNATQAVAVTEASNSFCDTAFDTNFDGGNAPCRPLLSNPNAPLGSVGINLGPGGYVDYVTGAKISPASEHWTWDNQYAAIAAKNPFPGVGRNILRGDTWNDVDVSAAKNIHITERFGLQMMVSVFNLMNRAYYGAPDINVEDSTIGSFGNTLFGFGTTGGSGAGDGAYPQGLGNRNVQLTGKVIF